jgi:probable HAF family extracellular repeat protein
MRRFSLLAFILLAIATSAYAQFTFTSIDFPGGTLTTAHGINNHGDIVGSYRIEPPRHALLIKAGKFIPLAPTTILGTNFSDAFKINDRGDIVGYFNGDDGFFHGFLLSKGVLTTLDFPGASETFAIGINESGTVVGFWDLLDADGNEIAEHGFTWKNGAFTEVNFPGAADTFLASINARGDLVGGWDPGLFSNVAHGLACSKKQCFSFDVPFPGSTLTQAFDISAPGKIVGGYNDPDNVSHAFLAVGANFTRLDFPDSTDTGAFGINSAGQIVGVYDTADGSRHGFLAQPNNKAKPE